MRIGLIGRILGLIIWLFSLLAFVPSIFVAYLYEESFSGLLDSLFICTFVGTSIYLVSSILRRVARRWGHSYELRTRDGFIITALFWFTLSLCGALPFLLSETLNASFADSIFESFSGLTTTGATVFTGLDEMEHGILFYRQILQWIGGIGIIVIAVAILPALGVGGLQLYKNEVPGPIKDSKLSPRIAETAKSMARIYLSLTAACAIAYYSAGMDAFDAISHSLSTIAIGGFSTHDASIGYFESTSIMWVASVFMFLAGLNFALHYTTWATNSIKHYLLDDEARFYFLVMLASIVLTVLFLWETHIYTFDEAFFHGMFMVISIGTTTGFATSDFTTWPLFLPFFLFFLAFIGGCAGSTGGGMKVMRIVLMVKQGYRELYRLVHPNAVRHVKMNQKVVPARILESVWGFISIYVLTFFVVLMCLLAMGYDYVTAFSAVAASINNLGPGLGEVAANYSTLSDSAKLLLSFTMLLGRLEVFTLLVLLTPAFWRN